MAQVTIYLPDDLRAQVKAAGIEVSAVCQVALRRAVADRTIQEQRAKLRRGDLTTDLAPPADPVGCTKQRHTGPFQRLGYLTRCGGCGQAV